MFAGDDNLFTLRAGNPARPVSWRWAAARVHRGLAPAAHRPVTDDFVREAVALQAGIETAQPLGDGPLSRLLLTCPDAADAYLYWTAGEVASSPAPVNGKGPPGDDRPEVGPLSGPALARAATEGLILAGKSTALVSKFSGLTEDAVRYYERWFFDVRDRLDRPGWVSAAVVGTILNGPPAVLIPNLIRAYGYYTKSARVVRAVATGFDAPAARSAAKNPARFFTADAASAGALKAALAVRLMPLTRDTYGRILELHHEAVDLDAKTQLTGGSDAEAKFRAAAAKLAGRVQRKYGEAPDEPPPLDPPADRTLPRLVDSVDADPPPPAEVA